MAPIGQKKFRVKGLNDKCILLVFLCHFEWRFSAHANNIWRKNKSVPSFPDDWDIAQNEKHLSNEATMLQYIENVIVPFVMS